MTATHDISDWKNRLLGRRGFLGNSFSAVAGIGLLDLLQREVFATESSTSSLEGWQPGAGQTQ